MKIIEKNPELVSIINQISEVRFQDNKRLSELCMLLIQKSNENSFPFSFAFAKIFLADYYLAIGDSQSAINSINEGIEVCTNHRFEELLAIGYNILGNAYFDILDLQMALDNYLKSLEIAYNKNIYTCLLSSYNNVGNMFYEQKDYTKAIVFFQKAEEIVKFLDDPDDFKIVYTLSIVYNNLCSSYLNTNKIDEGKAYLDKIENLKFIESKESKIFVHLSKAKFYFLTDEIALLNSEISTIIDILRISDERTENIFEIFSELFDILFKLKLSEPLETCLKIMHNIAGLNNNLPRKLVYYSYRIQHLELFSADQVLILKAYRKYYNIQRELDDVVKQTTSANLLLRINLYANNSERAKIKRQQKRLKQMSSIDGLCNVANRRSLRLELKKNIKKGLLNEKKVGIIIFDIDYFKEYNDHYGHIAGDRILKRFALMLKKASDDDFFVSRFGGDEFICIAYDKDDQEIGAYIQKVQKTLDDAHFEHKYAKTIFDYVTFSAGYSNKYMDSHSTPNGIIETSDVALYIAKQNGRNQFIGNIDSIVKKSLA